MLGARGEVDDFYSGTGDSGGGGYRGNDDGGFRGVSNNSGGGGGRRPSSNAPAFESGGLDDDIPF